MPKSLYVDPSVVRAPGKVTFNEIPVNQYNKTVKEELESGSLVHKIASIFPKFTKHCIKYYL